MKIAVLATLLLMSAIRADEYELNEQENAEVEAQEDPEIDEAQKANFLKSFICIIGTDRHINSKQSSIMTHQSRHDFRKRFDKLTANTYRTCIETIDEETMQSFLTAKSREEVEAISFAGLEQFDHEAVLSSEEAELSEEERMILENYNAVKKNLEKMQKDQKKTKNSEESENDEPEIGGENLKRNELQIAGLQLQGATLNIVVLIIVALFSGIIFFLWSNLFKTPVVKQGKKADKRKKRAE